jgi:hypothetical protein
MTRRRAALPHNRRTIAQVPGVVGMGSDGMRLTGHPTVRSQK